MGADDHILVAESGVAPLDARDDVPVGDDLARDARRKAQELGAYRCGRGSALGLRGAGELSEGATGGCEQCLRERGRDLGGRNAHRFRPAREGVARNAPRALGPERIGVLRKVRFPRVTVDVADEEDADRSGLLGVERLADVAGVLRGDDAVEGTLGMSFFSRFVVEDDDDLAPPRVARVVVVAELGRADPEADEDGLRFYARARAERQGMEILPENHPQRSAVRGEHLELVARSELGAHEAVALVVGAFVAHGREPEPSEARSDILRREPVLRRLGEPTPHGVRGEEEKVGTKLLLENGVVSRGDCLPESGEGNGKRERDE